MAFKGADAGHISQREIEDLQRDSEVFETIAAYYHSQYNVTGDGPPEAAPCAINTHQLFEVLGVRFAHGAPFNAAEDFLRQYKVVLTHDFWQRRFAGDPDIVGRSIVLDGGSYVVDGVLEDGTEFPPGVQLYRQVTEYHGLDGRRHSVLARLRPGATLEQAQRELASFSAVWQERTPELNRGLHFEAVPLRDSWVGPARPYLLTLAGAVFFVLLIAIVNAVHLLLARAAERQAEMAVRASLGAGRMRLMRLLLVESVVLAALGGGLGVLLAGGWLRVFTDLVSAQLPAWMEIRLDPAVLAAVVLLVIVSGVLAGLAPALGSSRTALGSGLRGSDSLRTSTRSVAGGSSGRLRNTLVTAEIALALVLLTGAGLMIRSFLALERQDLGFDAKNLFTVRVDPPYWTFNKLEQVVPFLEQATVKLEQIPGVTAVAANQNLPLAGLDGNTKRVITLEGQPAPEQETNPFVHLQSVGPGYFEAMGIPLRRGRVFASTDRADTPPVAVVSRRLAERLWPEGEAIDRRLKLGPPESEAPWLTVVGIAGNVRSESRAGEPSLDLYVSHLQHFTGDTFFALRTQLEGDALRRQVEAAIQSVNADLPLFNELSMDDRVARVEWQRQTTSHLFVVFGFLALALAAFGIYAVISYQVTRRTHEMGIRQALGARPRDLVKEILRHALSLFFRGSVLGALAGLGLVHLIGSMLYGIEATDPLSTVGAWLALLLALVVACLVPARRVARLDPLRAIREGQE